MMLEVNGVGKNYKDQQALQNITFSIAKGEIVGIIGPNGSGKTTLLNILIQNIKSTSGSFNMQEGARVGMSISRKGFFDDMTVSENINMYSKLINANNNEVQQLMNQFSIDYGKMRFGKLSAGMKQRVSLILAFLLKNDLIFLDEPTNHLDIDSILNLRSMILDRKKSQTSFLITSHIFSDLEKVCDRILFLKNGLLINDSATSQLLDQYGDLEQAYLNIFNAN